MTNGAGFIAKYFNNGSLVWRLKIDGSSLDQVDAVTTDLFQVNAASTVIYEPDGQIARILSGNADVFAARFLRNGSQ